MKYLSKLAAGALAATMLAAGTVTAAAEPFVNETFEYSDSFVIDDCDGLELLGEESGRGHVLINSQGSDGLEYFQANVGGTGTITNPATGLSITYRFRFLDQDLKVSENEDGTFTVIIKVSGPSQTFGPDGKLLFVDTGQAVFQTLWAGDGDFPSDGTQLDGVELKNTGRLDTRDRDFCADMHEFLG
jgi:hypothetical protein